MQTPPIQPVPPQEGGGKKKNLLMLVVVATMVGVASVLFLLTIRIQQGDGGLPERTSEEVGQPSTMMPQSQVIPPQATGQRTRVIYATYEDPNVNIYSALPDGSDRKIVVSEKPPAFQSGLEAMLRLRVSPRRDLLAYALYPRDTISIVNTTGERLRTVRGDFQSFGWSPDGENFLYNLQLPSSSSDTGGVSLQGPAREWYLLNAGTGEESLLASRDVHRDELIAWAEREKVLFADHVLGSKSYYLFDVNKKESSPLPNVEQWMDMRKVSVSPSGRRRVLFAVPSPIGRSGGLCEFLEFGEEWQFKQLLFSERCQSGSLYGDLGWNGDDELFYTEATTEPPQGLSLVNDSINKYDFRTRQRKPVLSRAGRERYQLAGVLEGQGLLVLKRVIGNPEYVLEVRSFDGREPVTIHSSNQEGMIVDWVRE
ncbi:MAG: hypothetical protein G01um101438_160 [Parcubacteria group bacterium Gr01-1014_38]|nr:MAG: hypothetical protein G01um101438_160 [Parcubacteria group bacterium Gr01-1014_38]